MSSRRLPPTGVNHPAKQPLTRGRVDPKSLKLKPDAPTEPEASDEPYPGHDYDFVAEARRAAAVLSRPLSKPDLRRMAMNLVRFAEIPDIAAGKRSGPMKGKTLRDALHAAEDRIKAARKSQRKNLKADAAGDAAVEWIECKFTNADGKEVIRAGYAIASPGPKMPSAEEAERRMMQDLELEFREHQERFLDESDVAALEKRPRSTPSSSDRSEPSHAELAAIKSQVKYEIQGQEFDNINAARKLAKVKKQTAKRVREHRARKAEKPADGEP